MNEIAPITFLLIEDDTVDQIVFERFVRREHLPYTYTIVGSVREAMTLLGTEQFDIIVLDYLLGDGTAFDVLPNIEDTPVIIVTGAGDEEVAVKAMKNGAYDYLIKDVEGHYMKTLPITVEKALHRKRTEDELQTYQTRLEDLVKARTIELENEIRERRRAEEAVRVLNMELEERVEERTVELREANEELQKSLQTLRKTQEQLVQSKKMAALGGLVTGIAHEINTPVGNSLTAASYLEQQSQDIELLYRNNTIKRSDLEHYLKIAREASGMIVMNLKIAANQIQVFKQVAVDQTSPDKRSFLLKAYIDDVLLSLYPKLKTTRHTIKVNCPDTLTLYSYPGAFSQILTNFVMNSLMHGFEQLQEGHITLDITTDQQMLYLRYADNGKGMSQAEQARIFEPFYTTKRGKGGGSGLGLHIVYNLVTQKLHGNIACDSAPGAGTVFLIRIPLRHDDPSSRVDKE